MRTAIRPTGVHESRRPRQRVAGALEQPHTVSQPTFGVAKYCLELIEVLSLEDPSRSCRVGRPVNCREWNVDGELGSIVSDCSRRLEMWAEPMDIHTANDG